MVGGDGEAVVGAGHGSLLLVLRCHSQSKGCAGGGGGVADHASPSPHCSTTDSDC